MAWLLLVLAGGLEVVFALSLGASAGFTRPWPSAAVVVFGGLAVAVLSRALRDIPLSTGYAAFTALGVLGTTAVAVTVQGERLGAARLAALALVVAGVVALRLTTPAHA
jgi:quaternary ammonium compound-resistance protein SugE